MSPQEFCYWLQGYFEVSGSEELTPEQVKVVKEHLQLVFRKETTNVVVKTPELNRDLLDKFRRQLINDKNSEVIVTCHTNNTNELDIPIC